MPFDPSEYLNADNPQQPTLKDYLTQKAKIPPGVAGLQSPQFKDLNQKVGGEALNAVAGSFMPEGTANPLAKPLEWAAEKTHLDKLPDWLMQKAVNIKKTIPGLGDNLIDQGLWGTKGMMQTQVGNKLTSTGEQIGKAIEEIPGNLSHAPVAQQLSEMSSKYTTPQGATSEAVQPTLDRLKSRIADISNRPEGPASELFGFKKLAQGEGYNRFGDPLAKATSQMAQKEGIAYGDILGKAYAESNPLNPDHLKDLNSAYSSLSKAQQGLNKSPGYGIEALLTKSLPKNLTYSVGAHALDTAGQAAEQAPNTALRLMGLDAAENPQSQPQESIPFDPKQYLGFK